MKDDRVYLQHILDAINDIAAYCGEDRGAFFADRMRQDATLRKLEVIGQAVKNLSGICLARYGPRRGCHCAVRMLHTSGFVK